MNSHVTTFSNTDMCFIFGANLKTESPLLNIRLRKQYLATALSILTFGIHSSVLYPTYFFGFKMKTLIKFIEGSNNFCKYLCVKKNPIFLFNVNLFKTETLYNFITIFQNTLITNNSNITKQNFNFFHSNIEFYNQLYLNLNIPVLVTLILLTPRSNFKASVSNSASPSPNISCVSPIIFIT